MPRVSGDVLERSHEIGFFHSDRRQPRWRRIGDFSGRVELRDILVNGVEARAARVHERTRHQREGFAAMRLDDENDRPPVGGDPRHRIEKHVAEHAPIVERVGLQPWVRAALVGADRDRRKVVASGKLRDVMPVADAGVGDDRDAQSARRARLDIRGFRVDRRGEARHVAFDHVGRFRRTLRSHPPEPVEKRSRVRPGFGERRRFVRVIDERVSARVRTHFGSEGVGGSVGRHRARQQKRKSGAEECAPPHCRKHPCRPLRLFVRCRATPLPAVWADTPLAPRQRT